jgi:PAS domain S-box-containing protein
MKQTQLTNLFLDQSKDVFWIINSDFQLIYANKRYLSFMREVNGEEKKLNESIFTGVIDEGYIKTWKAYYSKALKGEYFEVEEHVYHQNSDQLRYTQVTFEPLTGEDDKIFAVACQSKDITRVVKEKSEENQLIDASLDVFCTVNEQGNFVYVSAASLNHWGYLPEELIGKAYKDLIVEEDIQKTNEIIESIQSGKDIKSFVNRYKKKDGSIAFNIWSARWDDRTKLIYAVARDGKEKIEQEEANLLSEQRYKSLVQDGSDLIRILDAEGNFIYVSPTSTSILGITPEEFMGKNIFDYIHPDDVAKALKCLQKITTEKKIIVAPLRFQNHEKEWRWMESVLTNMLDNPAVNGIVVNSRDVTAKIEKEHQLKLFESVITNTNDAVLITEAEPFDEPGPRIIYVNEAFTKMTGYSAEEVIGKTPRILQGPNSNSEELSRLSAAIRNWESCEITTINYKKNGEEFWINFAVTPVANEEGWYTHWIAIERDVTAQKTNELEKEVIAQISMNFNTEDDLTNASNKLCISISDLGKFDWVELWTVNLEKSQMQLFSHYVADPKDEKFYEDSSEFISYSKSEGLPGIVWSKGEPLLLENVGECKEFIRRDSAKKIGLKSVIGIPLFSNDEVIGILNIGSKHGAWRINNYTQVFKKLEGFIGSMLNRKKLENDLSHFFNAIPDIICVMDFQGKFLKINNHGCELLGFRQEDILYHNFEEFNFEEPVHSEGKDSFRDQILDLKEGEGKFKFENRFITSSGNIVWLSWYCTYTLKEGLIYATGVDITERKKAEKNILQSNERFEKVTEATNDAIWDWDIARKTYYRSKAFERFFGKDASGLFPEREKWTKKYFYPDDFDKIKHSFDEAIANPLCTRWESEYRVINELGETLFVIDRAVILRNSEGKVIRVVGAMTDTSESKRMTLELRKLNQSLEQHALELERSNEELEQFAFVASHDLQAPLRMISSFMDLLERKYGHLIDEKGHQYIHYATDGAKRMRRIILDLLDYSRASKTIEEKEDVDINELLSEFRQLRRKIISEKSATISSKGLPKLKIEKVAIIQILHCLLDNALTYSQEGTPPMIEINAVENKKEWEFSIKDNGIGIEPQFYDKIFIIFQRLHNREKYEGTGIGLSIAKKHVEILGGRIWLKSAPGEGTVFYFTIPKTN